MRGILVAIRPCHHGHDVCSVHLVSAPVDIFKIVLQNKVVLVHIYMIDISVCRRIDCTQGLGNGFGEENLNIEHARGFVC